LGGRLKKKVASEKKIGDKQRKKEGGWGTGGRKGEEGVVAGFPQDNIDRVKGNMFERGGGGLTETEEEEILGL